jgi:DNA-binding response OmpR family regulator
MGAHRSSPVSAPDAETTSRSSVSSQSSERSSSERSSSERSSSEMEGSSPAICVIEDDIDLLAMMVNALRDAGYRVIEANDGAQFLRTFARAGHDRSKVDVLVTDNRMPSISGLSVLEKAREKDWVHYAILVSAYVDEDVRAEASRLGASVLPKPFSIETLLAHVNRLAPLH